LDLEAEILREHSKRQTVRIAQWIGADKKRFRQLMELLLHGEPIITQRAAWILSECSDHYPFLVIPWIPPLLKKMKEEGVHNALKRNVVRLLQCVDIPRAQLGPVASICFEYLNAADAPVAVKANAMTVLQKIAEREPDLTHELHTSIEIMLPHVGAALGARGKMVLKQLERIENRSTGKLKTPNL
jgi:hypothetical protein